jgi:hypothetical protein
VDSEAFSQSATWNMETKQARVHVQYFQQQGMRGRENTSNTTNGGQIVAKRSSLVDSSLPPEAKEARSLTPALAVAQIKKMVATK